MAKELKFMYSLDLSLQIKANSSFDNFLKLLNEREELSNLPQQIMKKILF